MPVIEDNPYRLPRTVIPSRYDVELAPDLAAASFAGIVRIEIDIVEETAEVVLNAMELEIRSIVLEPADGPPVPVEVTYELDESTERMIIRAGQRSRRPAGRS